MTGAVAQAAKAGRWQPGYVRHPVIASGAMNAGALVVRPLSRCSVSFAVSLHSNALPGGFFVELGPVFLRRYYETFIDSPYAIAMAVTSDAEPCGALVGTVDDQAHYRWVLRNRALPLAAAAVWGLASRPSVAVRFARTRARRYLSGARRLLRSRGEQGARTAAVQTGALTHVAVTDEARGSGVGSALVEAFTTAAFARGAGRLRVATRSTGGATEFYEHLGWQPGGSTQNLDGIEYDVLTLER